MTQIYLLGDVCRRLHLKRYRLNYAISTGQLPEPSERLGGKRIFTENDVQRIAEHFGVEFTATPVADGEVHA